MRLVFGGLLAVGMLDFDVWVTGGVSWDDTIQILMVW